MGIIDVSAEELDIEPGQVVVFRYPWPNTDKPLKFRSRRLLVKEVRDVARKPLSTITIERNPERCRGRWLIIGLDLDLNEERKFYRERMLEYQMDTWLQLGIHDPLDELPCTFLSRPYAQCPRDMRAIQVIIAKFNHMAERDPTVIHSLAVFPVAPDD